MEKYNQVFERYELKYVLTPEEYENVTHDLKKHMKLDRYGRSSIQSVYYDTPDSRLVRKSLDKPVFKEKLRLRSYGLADDDSPCFLELKRKANGLVYKRRIPVKEKAAGDFMNYKGGFEDTQIAREMTYFRDYYKELIPSMLIIYERESYYRENSEVRVTFDFNPRYRKTDLNLHTSLEGIPLLDENLVLMEIKVLHNMPLWLTRIINENHLKKGSVSKYGEAFKKEEYYCAKGMGN